MKVLFICSGNSCRSPMAEYYFRHLAKQQHCEGSLECASAGLYAMDGMLVSDQAMAVLGKYGIQMIFFRSRLVSEVMVEEANMIVAMTRRHALELAQRFPGSADKVTLLAGNEDIPDPFGGSLSEYKRIFEIMKKHIDLLFKQLKTGKV